MHMQKIAMSKIINQKQQNYRKNKRQSWWEVKLGTSTVCRKQSQVHWVLSSAISEQSSHCWGEVTLGTSAVCSKQQGSPQIYWAWQAWGKVRLWPLIGSKVCWVLLFLIPILFRRNTYYVGSKSVKMFCVMVTYLSGFLVCCTMNITWWGICVTVFPLIFHIHMYCMQVTSSFQVMQNQPHTQLPPLHCSCIQFIVWLSFHFSNF
jgi:hypothetical protein